LICVERYDYKWISSLPLVKNKNTYVTRNKKDIVLRMSGIVNNKLNISKSHTRLGNRKTRSSEKGSPLKYIDFTGLDNVGLGHGIAWSSKRSTEVVNLCRPIITGV